MAIDWFPQWKRYPPQGGLETPAGSPGNSGSGIFAPPAPAAAAPAAPMPSVGSEASFGNNFIPLMSYFNANTGGQSINKVALDGGAGAGVRNVDAMGRDLGYQSALKYTQDPNDPKKYIQDTSPINEYAQASSGGYSGNMSALDYGMWSFYKPGTRQADPGHDSDTSGPKGDGGGDRNPGGTPAAPGGTLPEGPQSAPHGPVPQDSPLPPKNTPPPSTGPAGGPTPSREIVTDPLPAPAPAPAPAPVPPLPKPPVLTPPAPAPAPTPAPTPISPAPAPSAPASSPASGMKAPVFTPPPSDPYTEMRKRLLPNARTY